MKFLALFAVLLTALTARAATANLIYDTTARVVLPTNLIILNQRITNSSINGTAVNLTGSLTNVTVRGGLTYDLSDESALSVGNDYGAALDVGLTSTSVRARLRTVSTIAALIAADPTTSDLFSYVKVLGYETAADGGGGDFQRVLYSTVSGTTGEGGMWFQSTANTLYAWLRVSNEPRKLNVAWWNPKTGSGYSATNVLRLQAALDYASELNGAELFFPDLYRINDTLVVKRNTKLVAARPSTYTEAATLVTNSVLYKGGYSGGITVDTAANITAIRFSASGGYLRQTNITMWDGTVVAEKRFLNSGLQNIIVQGNSSNQTNTGKPLIEAQYLWNVSIQDCYIGDAAGPSIWLRDVNGATVRNNFVQAGRGIILDDVADSDVSHNMTYASFGPSWKVISSWKNTFVGNHSGNATNGLQGTVSSVSGNVLTASADHNLYTGTILWIYATTTMPSPMVSTRPYYVIRLSSTTFSVASTLTEAEAGTAVTLTTTGSGTITYTDGPAYSWLLASPSGPGTGAASGTIRNTFVGSRCDQNYEGGWFLDSADENTFAGNYVIESGFYGTNIVRGAVFTNGASYNSFTGNEIDASNDIGFSIGDNSVANVFSGNSVLSATPWEWGSTGTSANYVPVAGQGSGTNIYGGPMAIGQPTDGNTLSVTGNASGIRAIKINRTSGLTQSIGLGAGTSGFVVWNETANVGIGIPTGDATQTFYLGGAGNGGASPRPLFIRPEDASSGTDSPGTNLVLQAAAGTGSSTTGGDIIFQTPDAGASGTTVQTRTTKATIQRDGDLQLSANLELGNASDTTLARSAAGRFTVESVPVALQPATETLTYSSTTVTLTAGKGPNQSSALTCTNAFTLTFSSVADNDGGTIWVHPAATNCTVTLTAPAYGPSGTTLTITGGTLGTNHTVLAWKATTVGGTNVVNVNALNYYR